MRSLLLVAVAVMLASCKGADDSSESVASVTIGVEPFLAYGMAVAAGLGGWFARGKWDERQPAQRPDDGEGRGWDV